MAPRLLLPTNPALLISRNEPFIHRDLSWLQFNERVLSEARQPLNPLLERLKFLAITASNLDEFFMIRFSSLSRSIATASKTNPMRAEQLSRIRHHLLIDVQRFARRKRETLEALRKELGACGIHLIFLTKQDHPKHGAGRRIFDERILPHLPTPENFSAASVNKLENTQMGVIVGGTHWIRVPRQLPWIIGSVDSKSGEYDAFFLGYLIRSHLNEALRLKGPIGVVRLTRDADVSLELGNTDSESIPDKIRNDLSNRDKGRPVRVQWGGRILPKALHRMSHALKIGDDQMIHTPSALGLHGLWTIYRETPEKLVKKHNLKVIPSTPFVPERFRSLSHVFDRLKERDYLLHHPYDSFEGYLNWIRAACSDPLVESIDQTIYRVDSLSPAIEALKSASSRKKVRILIELRARFDELNNVALAEELRKAGAEVHFGFGKLKLHAKLTSVTRREGNQVSLYTHLSTGNYNAQTARIYTDLALFTANPVIGSDAQSFFNSAWNQKVPEGLKLLVAAPTGLHRKLQTLIDSEVKVAKEGRKARIVAKMNALVDETIVERLYHASQAGVKIDLIVRGACSLIPGVRGLSENIRVISIVDHFLEHSRLYYFGASKALYLSSADWMPRNLYTRLELAYPIIDPRLYQFVEQVLIPAYLLDTIKSRELTPQGVWKRRGPQSLQNEDYFASSPLRNLKSLHAQKFFEELANQGYQGTPLQGKAPQT